MKKRIVSLGFPILTWGIIDFVISLINNGIFQYRKVNVFSLVGGAWFLWAILMCTTAVVVNRYFFYVLIMITGLFFTDRFNLGYFKFLHPFLLQVIAEITYMK